MKRRLEQHLLLRGSRDFATVEEYELWIGTVVEPANKLRSARLAEELAVIRPLSVSRLPRYRELPVRVSSNGTIRVPNNTYSVPPRLRGERLIVRLFDLHLEVHYGDSRQLVLERLRGEGKHQIDYRHVIGSLWLNPDHLEPDAWQAGARSLATQVIATAILDHLLHHTTIIEAPKPFIWTKRAGDTLEKVTRAASR